MGKQIHIPLDNLQLVYKTNLHQLIWTLDPDSMPWKPDQRVQKKASLLNIKWPTKIYNKEMYIHQITPAVRPPRRRLAFHPTRHVSYPVPRRSGDLRGQRPLRFPHLSSRGRVARPAHMYMPVFTDHATRLFTPISLPFQGRKWSMFISEARLGWLGHALRFLETTACKMSFNRNWEEDQKV